MILHIVIGPMSFGEFLKALNWVHYFLIFSLMTLFLSLKSQTFVTSQMRTLCIPMAATFLKATYLKMQKTHHKSLKVIYQFDASYDDLLQLSNSVSLHQRHLRFLLTEIYKSTGTLNPQFVWSYFKYRKVPYNLRRGPILFIPPAKSTVYDTNSVHFFGPLIWNGLPNLVKSIRSISEFKNVIKRIGNIDCGCMICRR